MTQRSKAELDSLFADNTSGLITPGRLRDFVESMACVHGSLYVTTPQPSTIVTPGTYVKVAGLTTQVPGAVLASMPADNRLRYDGVSLRHAHIVANISVTCASNNQTVGFCVAKNGVPLEHSKMEHRIGTGADIIIVTIHSDVDMVQNDYLELWCANLTSTASITTQKAYLFFMGMFE